MADRYDFLFDIDARRSIVLGCTSVQQAEFLAFCLGWDLVGEYWEPGNDTRSRKGGAK